MRESHCFGVRDVAIDELAELWEVPAVPAPATGRVEAVQTVQAPKAANQYTDVCKIT